MTLDRPRSVRVASTLLLGGVGIGAGATLTAYLSMEHLRSAGASLLSVVGSDAVGTISAIHADLRYQLIVALAATLLLAYHAVTVRRPSQKARVAAGVSAFVLAVAWSCGIAQSTEVRTQLASAESAQVKEAYGALLPDWYARVTGLLGGRMLLLLVAAAVSLLRTSASEYYRRPSMRGEPGLYTFVRKADPPPAPPDDPARAGHAPRRDARVTDGVPAPAPPPR